MGCTLLAWAGLVHWAAPSQTCAALSMTQELCHRRLGLCPHGSGSTYGCPVWRYVQCGGRRRLGLCTHRLRLRSHGSDCALINLGCKLVAQAPHWAAQCGSLGSALGCTVRQIIGGGRCELRTAAPSQTHTLWRSPDSGCALID